MKTNSEVTNLFLRLLAKDVAKEGQHLLNVAYDSLRKKVADTLIKLVAKYSTIATRDFLIDMSHENLAAVAGTANESLIRTEKYL